MKTLKRFHQIGMQGKSVKRDRKQQRRQELLAELKGLEELPLVSPTFTAMNGRKYFIASDGSIRRADKF